MEMTADKDYTAASMNFITWNTVCPFRCRLKKIPQNGERLHLSFLWPILYYSITTHKLLYKLFFNITIVNYKAV